MAGSYGDYVFNFLKNSHVIFHSKKPSHEQCIGFQFLHIFANTSFSILLIIAILMGVM